MSQATFKVASYNIRKCIGTDRRRDPMRVLRVIEEVNADIIALQEADRRFGKRVGAIPQFLIERHSDYRPVPFDVQIDSLGWHGNTILVRQDILVEHHDIIHIPYLEPRGVVLSHVKIGALKLAIFGMHLDLSGLWRTRQARAIMELAEDVEEGRSTLLMGDLNEWRPNAGCFREFARHLTVLDCGRSYHSQRPVGKLDRIMHSRCLETVDYGVHRSSTATKASDHLPVWAEFKVDR